MNLHGLVYSYSKSRWNWQSLFDVTAACGTCPSAAVGVFFALDADYIGLHIFHKFHSGDILELLLGTIRICWPHSHIRWLTFATISSYRLIQRYTPAGWGIPYEKLRIGKLNCHRMANASAGPSPTLHWCQDANSGLSSKQQLPKM